MLILFQQEIQGTDKLSDLLRPHRLKVVEPGFASGSLSPEPLLLYVLGQSALARLGDWFGALRSLLH